MRTPCVYALILTFIIGSISPTALIAQELVLPAPGTMVHRSTAFQSSILKGIKVHPDNPFKFDFVMRKGDGYADQDQLKAESVKLIKYFLASLTVPEKDLWVNLSPYEKNRIVPEAFGQTEMGRDLLAQDYLLKQITALLMYPEGETGKKFWKKIYEESAKRFGNTNIPVNTFNKVWIVPEKAVVYENAKSGTAYVVESKLKVMIEADYLATQKYEAAGPAPAAPHPSSLTLRADKGSASGSPATLAAQIIKEIILPELTKEINAGQNFAQLRQVYNSLILAIWYKKKIKDSILAQVYNDKNKFSGVNISDPQEKQKIYQRYLQAFKKGVYNYIKETEMPNGISVPRKYFSGGVTLLEVGSKAEIVDATNASPAMLKIISNQDSASLVFVPASINDVDKLNGPITPARIDEEFSGIERSVGTDGRLKTNLVWQQTAKEQTGIFQGEEYLQMLDDIHSGKAWSKEKLDGIVQRLGGVEKILNNTRLGNYYGSLDKLYFMNGNVLFRSVSDFKEAVLGFYPEYQERLDLW